ncbi:D-alanyl-D-alanine carboxypeptidase family protein [Palleronia sp. KMU-117]|uniref:D-alanyl-D-alanine carboxypeptidase family protein n=1 Tax=Palleronia sp. KMU-117 TaxID=3434108 RepID=UPI003D75EF55
MAPATGFAAPFASMVIDARSGEVLQSTNADTRLHPASLTKMMTLYIAFQAVENGELSLDTVVTISQKAASEPPSKLGLRAGQKIKLRYLIRAAAIKSANDAATAIGEAISGSEAAFARRMTRTAQAMGMTRTTFKNAHGLTEAGHLSTARDMTILGRHVFYDYPEYYNIFSRITTDAGGKEVANTNRRFLTSYRGADGIKTGFTNAAGFNLVASAERGGERIIATVFGGTSTAARNAKVAELLDLGFRKAPTRVAVNRPAKPRYDPSDRAPVAVADAGTPPTTTTEKTLRVVGAVSRSMRPLPRPDQAAPADEILLAMQEEVDNALAGVTGVVAAEAAPPEAPEDPALATVTPAARPEDLIAEADIEPSDAQAADVAVELALAETLQDLPMGEDEVTDITPAMAEGEDGPEPDVEVARLLPASAVVTPLPRPSELRLAVPPTVAPKGPEVVTRMSTSGGRHWGINVGHFGNRNQAERMLLQTALVELSTLEQALRKVVQARGGYDANFVGMTEEQAALACRRLIARSVECQTLGPSDS